MLQLPSPNTTLTVCADFATLAERAAQAFADAARTAIAARGRFTVALAGGSTPEKTYRLLAGAPYDREIDWTRVHVFFGDERFVPADDDRSNYALAHRTLLTTVGIPTDQIFAVDTTLPTPADAALAYAETLRQAFGDQTKPEAGVPIFDLILLGLGDDGHTASLFPHKPSLSETNAFAIASPPGVLPPPVDRITLTFPVLNAARAVLFLIAGANKAEALADILEGGATLEDRPAAGVKPLAGTLTYLVDEAAAADLKNKESQGVTMTERVREILSWYGADSPGTLTNLARLMNHGRLAGTGKFVILPVDQGFEHGPARSFAPNPPAYDPRYHFELAIEAGCNAYAAPLGFLEAAARDFAGEIPLILKANDHDLTMNERDPNQALTGSVEDALRLGCAAIGFTIYPGSSHRFEMYEQVRALAQKAKQNGLAVVIWSYPRGSEISKDGETAIDICGYAAQIACQLGAHIVKVKLPTDFIEQDEARKVYESQKIPIATQAERVRHVVQQCSFGGRRITIFSGGTFVGDDNTLLDEVRAIHEGGGFGSIMGRNSFQRPKAEAIKLLQTIMDIYKG